MRELIVFMILLIVAILHQGCGGSGPCTTESTDEGIVLACPGSEPALIQHGQDGADGENGKDGRDGRDGIDGDNGVDGKDGTDGKDGVDGVDGENYHDQLIYVGYYCARIVLQLHESYYVMYTYPVLLTSNWFQVSTTCQVRVRNNIIETSIP